MRRSICFCEPAIISAGEVGTWKFIYTTATALPKGTRIKFDLQSKGRSIDWETPHCGGAKEKANVIYGIMDDGKVIYPKEVPTPQSPVPSFEFVLPQKIAAENNFTVVIGAPNPEGANTAKNGNRAQTCSQRRRTFAIHIDTNGKGKYEEPELFTLDVRGNTLENIKVMAPSVVAKNKRFDVVVRFEDEFGNLTSLAPENTLIEISHENLRENLNWKLFVPETGYMALPNLYFNEPGVYTITLKNSVTKEAFQAPPIKCFLDNDSNIFWGLLHGESERFDSTENIESCLRHFRDECGWSFVGASPFESQEETNNELWRQIVQTVTEFDEVDRFVAFIGAQWVGTPGSEGVRHLVFAKENKVLPRKKEAKFAALSKLYKSFSPKEMLSVPSFSMGKGAHYNFKNYDPDFERVVEIYNAWGSSECTAAEGNMRPITTAGKKGIQETGEGAVQQALNNNCRFGFIAGGLDDRGIYNDFFEGDQVQYSPGATATSNKEHSRQALFDALYNRSCYATTGPRIILGLAIAGVPMGGELTSGDKPGLNINRHLTGYAVGTTQLEKVEIIRNGELFQTITPDGYHCEFAIDDMDPLKDISLLTPDKKNRFSYYYLRVLQADGNMAWSSPIWVDFDPNPPKKKPAKAAPAPSKSAAPAISPILDDEDDEEDEDLDDDL